MSLTPTSFDDLISWLEGELEPLRYPALDLRQRYGETYCEDALFILERLARFAQQGGDDLGQALRFYTRHLQEVVVERQRYQSRSGPYGKSERALEALWEDVGFQRRYLYSLTLSTVFNRCRYELLRDFRTVLARFAPIHGSILEIGAGNCLNASLASAHGKVVAYERNHLSRLWQHLLDPPGKIDLRIASYHFDQPASYDMVLMIELLEHLADPLTVLRGAHRVLKNPGLAYLTFALRMPQEDHLYEFTSIDQCRQMVQDCAFHLWQEQCLIDTYYPFVEEERWLLGEDESQAVVYCCLVGTERRPETSQSWFNEEIGATDRYADDA